MTIVLVFVLTVSTSEILHGRAATSAHQTPPERATIVNVSTEAQLQTAVRHIRSNTTIVLAPGVYQLTSTLYINGTFSNVAIHGGTDHRDDVVLRGRGMANAAYGDVPHGIWTGGNVQGVTIANLTIRDVYFHPIVFDSGTESPRVSNVHLIDAGQQFIKSNPDRDGGGVDDGIVEDSTIEHTTAAPESSANGVDVQTGANWIIRHNLFRNIVALPDQPAASAVLMWNASSNTLAEGNKFLNCARGIAYGLVDRDGAFDHRGGAIQNNFFYRSSAQAGDAAIVVADSPDTNVSNNTIYLSGTYATPIEYRFAGTTGVMLKNNLLDGFLWARDGATGTEQNNLTGATSDMFVNAPAGDLHLAASATSAIDHGVALAHVRDDWDGQPRPSGLAHDIGADEYVAPAITPASMTAADSVKAGWVPVAASGESAPVIDAVAWGDQLLAVTNVATSAFSTSAGDELLLAFISVGGLTNATVTSVSGAGLPWQLVRRTNAQRGGSEIWRAFAATPLTNVSVNATLGLPAASSITVVSFSGVDTSGTNGSGAVGATGSGNANPGAPTATLTTTRDNSWVFGVGNDGDAATPRTLGPNQTVVHQYIPLLGGTYWVQRTASPTPLAGTSVTINDVAPSGDRYNLTLAEIVGRSIPDTVPPTVSITAPANGATVSGTSVTVSATAADNVGVVGVQFKLDGANLGTEDTASPYTRTWDTTGTANGSHTVTAVARDAAGNTTTSAAVSVTVNNADTTAPTVSLTAPANGATVSGAAVTVSATAADNVGVVGVQFKLDGANLSAEDTTSPFSIAWDSTTTANGSHTVTAVARDAAGNTTTSTAVSVTVNNTDTTDPTVSLTAPANGATVSGAAVTVSATAADNVGVVGVQFKLDGANLGAEDTASPYTRTWDSTATANGSHTVTAVARDAAGNTTTSTAVSVTVNNTDTTDPTVSLTAPANGATVSGAAVTVSATAADNVGVVGVQFKLDGANLGGEDTTSPYSIAWNSTTTANGSHTLTAVARDAAGNTTTSTSRTVTVNNATGPPTTVIFQASTDHAAGVTSYLLEVFASGANPDTASTVASSDLGKPAPDGSGDITVNRASFFSGLAPGTYVATVSAVGSDGSGRSSAVTFTR